MFVTLPAASARSLAGSGGAAPASAAAPTACHQKIYPLHAAIAEGEREYTHSGYQSQKGREY
eukprot:116904-Prorocentrum_minimum.AAC.1